MDRRRRACQTVPVGHLAITVTAAVVPSLLLMWYMHSRDRFPEPARIVWTTFALGIACVIPVAAYIVALHLLVPVLHDPITFGLKRAFLHAAIPEETCKLLVVVFYCMRRSEFDEPMDGFVYGVAASLGFATLENILFVTKGGLGVALMRALTAVPAHALFGAVMGYFAALALFTPHRRRAYLFMAWLIPVLLHGLYDFPLLAFAGLRGGGSGLITLIMLYSVPVAVLISGWKWVVLLSGKVRAAQVRTAALSS